MAELAAAVEVDGEDAVAVEARVQRAVGVVADERQVEDASGWSRGRRATIRPVGVDGQVLGEVVAARDVGLDGAVFAERGVEAAVGAVAGRAGSRG